MPAFNGQAPDREFSREHGVRFEICTPMQLREREPAITGPFRRLHPHDNNERQAVHEHAAVVAEARP